MRPDPSRPANEVGLLRWTGSDTDLLELVRRGDPNASARIYDRFASDVNRIVRRCLGPDQDQHDVVHDAFVQILKGVARVRDSRALPNWVMTVAVNTAREEIRRRRFRRRFWAPDAPPEFRDPTIDEDARASLGSIYTFLDTLRPDDRIAFVLRFVERNSLQDAADLMRCSLSTTKRRVRRASDALAAFVADDPQLAARLRKGAAS